MREYVTQREEYHERYKRWRDEFGRIGDPPQPPVPPQHLLLWLELQRFPHHLLVAGGLLDQPAWTWDLILLAGAVYEETLEQNERIRRMMQGTGEPGGQLQLP